MDISVNQLIWVRQHGGRFLSDVFWNQGKVGIYMNDANAQEQFYELPDDDRLILIKRKRGNKEYPKVAYAVKEK